MPSSSQFNEEISVLLFLLDNLASNVEKEPTLPSFGSVRSCPKCEKKFDTYIKEPSQIYESVTNTMYRGCTCGYHWYELCPDGSLPISKKKEPTKTPVTNAPVAKAIPAQLYEDIHDLFADYLEDEEDMKIRAVLVDLKGDILATVRGFDKPEPNKQNDKAPLNAFLSRTIDQIHASQIKIAHVLSEAAKESEDCLGQWTGVMFDVQEPLNNLRKSLRDEMHGLPKVEEPFKWLDTKGLLEAYLATVRSMIKMTERNMELALLPHAAFPVISDAKTVATKSLRALAADLEEDISTLKGA
jgi:hypothetical protein